MIFDLKPESSGKSLSNVTEAEKKERNPTKGVDYCDELDKNKNLGLIQIKLLTSNLAPLSFGCLVPVAYSRYEDNRVE